MAVIENLTDEECYLWALISDPSGLDQAEFTWYNPDDDDGCFRAWPFQWRWWRNTGPFQIDQCARSVGKSLSIKVRACAFPFIHPNSEMVITAPEGVHLEAITDIVETQLLQTRLTREMLNRAHGRSAIKHKPFHINFANGARIMGRIPQRDGKGVKGIHPIWLELDEAQDYPDPGWVEIIETLKRGFDGAVWRAHGVTRGVRDYFYKFTQPESGWTVHRYTAMHRPNWSDMERQEKIESYGSRDHPDYRRNVLGLHGDATNPLFVLHRLMACVDQEQESDYNNDVYTFLKISDEYLQDVGGDISTMIQRPGTHAQWKTFWIGMDVGYTNHPSEIVVFGERVETKGKPSVLTLLMRVHLDRISHPDQVATILHLCRLYNPKVFALDKTGLGLPLFQDAQGRDKKLASIIKGYNFSSKILVDIDTTKEVDDYRGDLIKEAGIERNVLEYATDVLRDYVDNRRVVLPWDKDLIGEFQGQTYKIVRDTMNQYGKREFNKGKFHALDACRMAVLGKAQTPIEEFVRKDQFVPVKDVFLF